MHARLLTCSCVLRQLKGVINLQLDALGLGKHQVLFNTDLYGQTSGTYRESVSALHVEKHIPHSCSSAHWGP